MSTFRLLVSTHKRNERELILPPNGLPQLPPSMLLCLRAARTGTFVASCLPSQCPPGF